MHICFRPSRSGALRRAIFLATAFGCVSAPIALPAMAAEQAASVAFSIPAQALDSALTQFADQAGLRILFTSDDVAGLRSAGLEGRYPVAEALSRLLQGSGYGFQFVDERTLTLRRAGADGTELELGATTINDTRESAWGHVDGYVATRSATGTKTDTPLIEIPQTVNVVTADEIEARGSSTIAKALLYTPGVSSQGFTASHMLTDEITSRGFAPAPLYLDGAYLPYAGSLGGAPQVEPYSLERIEVLKGPASVLFGQNEPGGIINMVTKKPTDYARGELKFGVASYDRVNGALDVSGPVLDDKSLLYRFLLVANSGNEQIDYTESQRLFVAPSLTWNLSDSSALTVYLQAQRDDGVPDYQPLPMKGTLKRGPGGQKIDRDFFQGEPGYNDYNREQYVLGLDFSHEFSDALLLRQNLRYVDLNDDYKGFYLRWYADPDNRTATRNKLDWQQHNSTISADNTLQYTFKTGELQHTLLGGVDYRYFSRQYDGYNNYFAAPIDLYNPDYSVISPNPPMDYQWDNTVSQIGLYLQDQIRLGDIVLTLGGRQDWAKVNNKDLIADTRTRQDDKAFTGRVGLTWLMGNGFAPYLSYAESFKPLIGTDRAGKAFDPTTGQQIEAGIKYQPPGSEALITLSAFEITQQNLTTQDPADPAFSVQQGEVRSRGAELEAKAKIAQTWDLIAGLSYVDTRTTKSNYRNQKDKQLLQQAPFSASLWANYQPLGLLDGLSLGGGVRWTGKQYGDANNTERLPGYAVVDAAVRYDLGKLDASLRGTEVSLHADNLLDKTYVASCNWELGCYYGKARTLSANVSYRW
ncbi:TonB-dependent siderophore receptor [Aquipseudomonas campi]